MSENFSRKMVIPGELVAEGAMTLGNGVYREGNKVYASIMGLLEQRRGYVKVIPLTGKYVPKVGDFVIGKITDVTLTNWDVDINSAYNAILNPRDYFRDIDIFQTSLLKILAPGDMIFASVREVTPTKKVYIAMTNRGARILRGGRLLTINPAKIPRVIGRKSSMISMIKKESRCRILVGQNGRIWFKGKPELVEIAVKAIKRIEREAHISGLTDRIKKMIIEEREKL
jgi:exosome complex component RRP4